MRDELSNQAKSATATVLSMVAGGLQIAASAAHQGAEALRPPAPTRSTRGPTAAGRPGAAPTGQDRPGAEPVSERAPATPPSGEGGRTATVIGDLAHRPAREITGEIDRLSADELRRLREHEQAGKQRKTVLDAVDKALAASQPS